VGGSAVHETTEHYDLMRSVGNDDVFKAEEIWDVYFNAQLDKAFEAEPNENKWGRSQAEPIEVWRRQGLAFVQSYIDWRERSPWEIWTTPGGAPAIELEVSGRLPGCPVEIKAYLDRIFWDPVFKKHHIVDLKTGKRPPKNADQFGTYKALTEVKYGLVVDSGVPFMNRKDGLGKPYDLTEFTVEAVGESFGEAWEQVQEYLRTGSWPANTNECFICDVQASCAAVNGPLAHQYDPSSPGYPAPF
jgi:RecB family exonuclease